MNQDQQRDAEKSDPERRDEPSVLGECGGQLPMGRNKDPSGRRQRVVFGAVILDCRLDLFDPRAGALGGVNDLSDLTCLVFVTSIFVLDPPTPDLGADGAAREAVTFAGRL